jgi:hypothetical protein
MIANLHVHAGHSWTHLLGKGSAPHASTYIYMSILNTPAWQGCGTACFDISPSNRLAFATYGMAYQLVN